jgi:signal transduction histidine kinase/ligand-binding sensor domain-containing protein
MESGHSFNTNRAHTPQKLRRLRTLLAFAFVQFGWFALFAQEYNFSNYTEVNGLPSSEAYKAIQDREGFVWIGTDNGVVRFDGEEFVVFNRSNGLTDNTVFGLYEDKEGKIWFRTYSGAISFYEKGIVYPYKHNSVLQSVIRASIINKLVVQDDKLWFATNGQGPAGSVDSAGNVTLIESETGFDAPAYLYTYALDSNEYLTGFTGTPRFMTNVVINGRQFPVTIDPDFPNSPVAQCINIEGSLYLSVNRDLFRYRGGQLDHVQSFDRPVINISTDRSNNLWVGFFGGGVRKYSDQRFDRFESIPELEQNSVSGTLQDAEGGYWFTTLDRGAFYFPSLEIKVSKYTEAQKISAVARTRQALYTGNYAGEIVRMTPDMNTREVVYKGGAPVSSFFEDRRGNLWWSSTEGYFVMSPSGSIQRRSGLTGIRGFFENARGEVCAFNSSSVYTIGRDNNPGSRIDLQRRPVAILATDTVIYLGSLYGLERYDDNFLPIDMTPFFQGRISTVKAAGPGVMLVGTIGNGLMVIDEGGRRMFNSKNGFNAENVYSIQGVGEEVWLGTEKGVLITSLSGLRTKRPIWKRFRRSSGLLSDKSNFLALADRSVLVFSDQGVSEVPVSATTYLNEKPAAYLKRIFVNNELQGPEVGQLEYTRNNISINIGVISYNNRQLLHRHRLHRTARWNYETGSNISYFDLNPGEYNIEVGASADNVNWYTVNQAIPIRINGPWWRSWIFIFFVGVLTVLISAMIYMLRVNAIKRKQEYLELINSHQQRLIDSEIRTQERERKRIATDLHDGVGTALSSIKLLLSDSVKARDGERDVRVNEINENLTDVIAEIRRIVYDLRPPALERYGLQVGLKNLTERINNHGGISVIYDYYGQREVTSHVSITVYRIVQELINNTLKHAKATEIRIHISQFDDEMNLMYEDNGIGMIGSRFSGLGLYSIESRVRSLSGRMAWESNHKGTFYNFDIPY